MSAHKMHFSRRGFLKAAAVSGAALSASLAMPRWARAVGQPNVKRLIIINAKGGVRWTSSFDGQSDLQHNPWGLVPSSVFGSNAPGWGVGRMLIQKPLPMSTTNWAGTIYPYISTSNSFNTTRVTLAKWGNAQLPSFADYASQIAVVRCTGNPGGTFDSDHGSAAQTVATGYRSGSVGLVTVFNQLLAAQPTYAQTYSMPGVQVASGNWGRGVGAYAASRPIALEAPYSLPTVDPGNSVTTWGRKMEGDIDSAFAASRQAYMGQATLDFINDKASGDAHVKQLIDPALHLQDPTTGSAALGTLKDGSTPVTNDMLTELFGLTSAVTPAGDILFDSFGAQHDTMSPTWALGVNDYGQSAALALRLLQKGAPIACVTVGNFDTHATEVIDPTGNECHPIEIIKLQRMLTGLAYALQNIADPNDKAATLWDSTVVLVVSEFGRAAVGVNGFNSPDGSNGGGSDHGPWAGWPLMGGPVASPGQLLKATTNGGFYHQNCVFTAIQSGFNVQESDPSQFYLPYDTFPPVANLITNVQGM